MIILSDYGSKSCCSLNSIEPSWYYFIDCNLVYMFLFCSSNHCLVCIFIPYASMSQYHPSNNSNVCTRGPNLRAVLAIPSEWENVVPRLSICGYLNFVPESPVCSLGWGLGKFNFAPLGTFRVSAFWCSDGLDFLPLAWVKIFLYGVSVNPWPSATKLHVTLVEAFLRHASNTFLGHLFKTW